MSRSGPSLLHAVSLDRGTSIPVLRFAINTSKASRPRRTPGTALPVRKAARVQAVTCLAQLALPRQAGNTQGGAATALNLHSPAVTGPPPTTQSPSTNKFQKTAFIDSNLIKLWLLESQVKSSSYSPHKYKIARRWDRLGPARHRRQSDLRCVRQRETRSELHWVRQRECPRNCQLSACLQFRFSDLTQGIRWRTGRHLSKLKRSCY